MNNESLRVLECLKISLRAFGSFGCATCVMDALQNEFEVIYKHSGNYCSGTVATVKFTIATVMCTVVTVKNLTIGGTVAVL